MQRKRKTSGFSPATWRICCQRTLIWLLLLIAGLRTLGPVTYMTVIVRNDIYLTNPSFPWNCSKISWVGKYYSGGKDCLVQCPRILISFLRLQCTWCLHWWQRESLFQSWWWFLFGHNVFQLTRTFLWFARGIYDYGDEVVYQKPGFAVVLNHDENIFQPSETRL